MIAANDTTKTGISTSAMRPMLLMPLIEANRLSAKKGANEMNEGTFS